MMIRKLSFGYASHGEQQHTTTTTSMFWSTQAGELTQPLATDFANDDEDDASSHNSTTTTREERNLTDGENRLRRDVVG